MPTIVSTTLLNSPLAPLTSKVALSELQRMKRRGDKIAAITAYDAPSGRLADLAGIDCVLVGDSAAMTTQRIGR